MTAIPLILISLASAGATPEGGVLLDFMAPWCGPCMQMSPVVEKLHREGYPIQQVNVDEHRDLAQQFNVTTIPAFVLVVEGREVNRIVGATTEGQLKRLLAQIPVLAETQLASSRESKPAASKASPERKSRSRASAEIVTINDSTEKKSKGFEFPLPNPFKKKKSQEAAVIVERDTTDVAVVRANNDGSQSRPSDGPVAASVRIQVKDNGGINFGSGTIIESRPGRSLILTCGHIFRSIQEGATVEVNIFHDNRPEAFTGSVVKFDLEAEVGVVSIESEKVFPVAQVASADFASARGDRVTSIGCSGGDPPTAERLVVTELNKYRGPDNVECTGLPVQGRSGGGLFNRDGEVIGVCFAADPKEDRGLYSGLKPIQKLLAACGMTSSKDRATETNDVREHAAVAAAVGDTDGAIREASARTEFSEPAESQPAEAGQAGTAEAQASADDMEEAEIVCIIRPLKRPQDASRVVIINRASSKFVQYLQGEMRAQPQQTMVRIPIAKDRLDASPDRPVQQPVLRLTNRPATNPQTVSSSEEPHRYRRSAASRGL